MSGISAAQGAQSAPHFFQNRLLLKLTDEGLLRKGFQVLKHSLIPPNDGGIALGQAAYGMAYLNAKRTGDVSSAMEKEEI